MPRALPLPLPLRSIVLSINPLYGGGTPAPPHRDLGILLPNTGSTTPDLFLAELARVLGSSMPLLSMRMCAYPAQSQQAMARHPAFFPSEEFFQTFAQSHLLATKLRLLL